MWDKYQKEKNENKKVDIRNEIVEIYYPLVRKISHRMAERFKWRITPDELSSFGFDGLSNAINKFDPERGVKFEAYATLRIQGSMIDNIRKEDLIPRSVRINNRVFERTREKLEGQEGRKVTEYEIVEEMGLVDEEFLKNKKKYCPLSFSSIDDPVYASPGEEVKQDLNINLTDKNIKDIDSSLTKKEFFSKLMGKGFSKQERDIIFLYYYKNLTMDCIADYIGMSESRISQIHKNLIPRLKEKIYKNPTFFADTIKKYSFKVVDDDC